MQKIMFKKILHVRVNKSAQYLSQTDQVQVMMWGVPLECPSNQEQVTFELFRKFLVVLVLGYLW